MGRCQGCIEDIPWRDRNELKTLCEGSQGLIRGLCGEHRSTGKPMSSSPDRFMPYRCGGRSCERVGRFSEPISSTYRGDRSGSILHPELRAQVSCCKLPCTWPKSLG